MNYTGFEWQQFRKKPIFATNENASFLIKNKAIMADMFVPTEILGVFKNLYPEVPINSVEWSWEVPGKIYEAEFEANDQEFEVEITVTGEHLLTETVIKDAIPKEVRNTFNEKYPDHKIESTSLVSYSNGEVFYEMDLTCAASGKEFEVLIRENGVFWLEGEDL